jgi:hypothetical protein
MAGGTFAQALGVLVFVIILLLLGELLWAYILNPLGRMLRDQGVVGLGRGVYSKFLEPILYGKDKSPHR